MEILKKIFEDGPFMPHGHCYFWTPSLIGLHVISDALIVLSYFSIPVTLIYFIRRRKDMQFDWMFVCFATFILACGTTHLMEIWNVWHGTYWLAGIVKAITALASVPTAILLVKLVPQALALPSAAQLNQMNADLQNEIKERKLVENRLRDMNETLEARVKDRTRELVRNHEILAINEARLLLAQQVADVGTFDWNIQTGENHWTVELEAMYGLLPGAFGGKHEVWEALVHPEDLPEAKRKVAEAMETDRFEGEWRVIWPDGSLHWLAGRASLFRDDAGKPLRLIGVNIDITARKVAEQQVQQLNTDLEKRVAERTVQLEVANKELEAFSYSISHDLRAPLRSINGYAGMLLENHGDVLPDAGKRQLERITNAGLRMSELIDDLLRFSKLSRQPLRRETVNTKALLQEVMDELLPAQKDRDIRIQIGEMPDCNAAPALLKQVWVNLVSNAIKYTRGKNPALIEIFCKSEGGQSVYIIKDNGAGFEMEYVGKLFGVFQRLHSADEFEGTGVGLAIVQRIVNRHGGRVWAEGELDRGATFYFTLESAAGF